MFCVVIISCHGLYSFVWIIAFSYLKHFSHSGTCQVYTGSLCLDYIAPSSQVFIRTTQSQTKSEEDLRRTLLLFTDYTSFGCGELVNKALCHHVFPPCINPKDPRPQLLCRDDCEMLDGRICSKEFHLAKLYPDAQRILPDCLRLPFSGGNSCLKLGLIGTKRLLHLFIPRFVFVSLFVCLFVCLFV